MPLQVKRAYDPASPDDGRRFLVDGIWPRGMTREQLQVEAWLKDLAPSTGLRKWFGHDPAKWEEFKQRYWAELDTGPASLAVLREALAGADPVTLVYAARDTAHNNAVALREYLTREG